VETDRDRLFEHVERLATVPRPYGSIELEQAQQYVTGQLQASGWNVERRDFDVVNDCGDLNFGETLTGTNLVATHPKSDSSLSRLIVGAHLDSRPETPGADDNASAVAVLLEIARLMNEAWPQSAQLDLELVAFDLEENGMLGGREHAVACRKAGDDIRGMISLEMLGYCDHARNSQALPRALMGLYPDTADFIAIIGNQNSGELIESIYQGGLPVSDLPLEKLQVPENGNDLQATRLSDHSPFWDEGFAAVMITDTSFLRNPHYHQATDTIDTLDFDFLHLVAEASVLAVRHLLING
jgi:Zn-dependent M28 family amino/carboxypeptidase